MLFFYRWWCKNSTHEKSERNSLNVVAMWDHPRNVNKGWELEINFMQKQCILLYRQHFCKEREYLRLKRQKYVVYCFFLEYFTYIGTLLLQVKHCKRYNYAQRLRPLSVPYLLLYFIPRFTRLWVRAAQKTEIYSLSFLSRIFYWCREVTFAAEALQNVDLRSTMKAFEWTILVIILYTAVYTVSPVSVASHEKPSILRTSAN